MLVLKQMHHLENAIYQIKVTNFVGSTTKEIAGKAKIKKKIKIPIFFIIYCEAFDICAGSFLQ